MNTDEETLKKAAGEVSKVMDDLGAVYDGIQIHVNQWGQWVAKYQTNDRATHYAFGYTLLDALRNLKENPNKEI